MADDSQDEVDLKMADDSQGEVDLKKADDSQGEADRERIFKRFDLDGDGRISATELGHCLETLGSVSSEEVQHMMSEIDIDGDGFISFQEFKVFALANRGLIKDVAKIF